MPASRTRPTAVLQSSLLALGLFAAGFVEAGTPIVFNVVNNDFTAWRINNVDNPSLTLARGQTYQFVMQNVEAFHPFYINTIDTVGTGNQYNVGVTNNGASGTMTLTFVVPQAAPDSLHYNCGNHASMNGPITIITDAIFVSGFD